MPTASATHASAAVKLIASEKGGFCMAKVKVKAVRHDGQPVKAVADTCCSCSSGCCCGSAKPNAIADAPYITGRIVLSAFDVPQISTKLSGKDLFGTVKVRVGIGRMNYKVEPGLYCVGNPDENSPVLVSTNYKLTFDSLRKQLSGLNLWLLILDTKGVNVWCAAGKGTFGTGELVRRIEAVKLGEIVKHRNVILPQLGATGVAAHEVAKGSGFHVIYGPVRAADVPAFLSAGMKATPEMRTVKFTFADRAKLTPVDFFQWARPLLILFGIMFILNAVGFGRFGVPELAAFLGAVAVGCVITPILLPWIPGRAFSFKGAVMGLLWAAAILILCGGPLHLGYLKTLSFLLLLPAISAYTAMNFTGSSTFTSPTGVNKEMHIAIPAMLVSSALGVVLLLADCVIKLLH